MLQRKLYRFQCEQRPIWVFLRDQQRWIEEALVVELEGDLVTLRYDAEDDDEVGVLIEETLIHEVGHYFGLSEEEIEAIEEQYWRNGADADER